MLRAFSTAPRASAELPAPAVESRFTAAAGWLLVLSLVTAPWAFGSRPYFWSALLAAQLLVAGLLWGVGLYRSVRLPRIPSWCLLCVLLLAGFMWTSFLNFSSIYSPADDRLVAIPGAVAWLPTTIDVANSFPAAMSLSGMLVALLVATDLAATAAVWRDRFLTAIAFTGFSVIVGGLLLKANLSPSLSDFLDRRPWAQGDIFGPFDYHGNAGSFINLVLPAIALQASLASTWLWRLAWFAAVLLACLAALVNTSRVGLVLTCASMPALGWIIVVGWKQMTMRAGALPSSGLILPPQQIVAALLILTIVVAAFIVTRGESRSLHRLGSLRKEISVPWYPRYMQNRAAWEMAQERPWFGSGIGSYRLLVARSSIGGNFFAPSYRPGQPYTVLSNTHDDYLQTLVEWGWLGTLTWMALVLSAAKRLWTTLKRSAAPALPECAIAIALATVFVHAVVDCPLQVPALQCYAVVYLGLACGTFQQRAASETYNGAA